MDFIALYVRMRKLSDLDEKESPLLEILLVFDPEEEEEDENSDIVFNLPSEPVVIFVMIPENLNLNHGKNRICITKI